MSALRKAADAAMDNFSMMINGLGDLNKTQVALQANRNGIINTNLASHFSGALNGSNPSLLDKSTAALSKQLASLTVGLDK